MICQISRRDEKAKNLEDNNMLNDQLMLPKELFLRNPDHPECPPSTSPSSCQPICPSYS